MKICIENGCSNKLLGRGYCNSHYYKHKYNGDFGKKCKAKGCNKGIKSNGLCIKHVTRLYKHGDYNKTLTIRSENPKCSVVGCKEKYHAKGFCSKHYNRAGPSIKSCTGRKLSLEHRAALSKAHKGKKHSKEHRKNISLGSIGRITSEETRLKLSKAHKGQKPSIKCMEAARAKHLGSKSSEATRRKQSLAQLGSKHHAWKGGVSKPNTRIRNSIDMKIWREKVFSRDDYTCQKCDKRGGDINAHHIKPFCIYPDLRFDISNGLTVCIPCHNLIHAGYRADLVTYEDRYTA